MPMTDPPKPIYVTQPTLPPLADVTPMLEEIWRSKVLTNGGAFHQQLEAALAEFLRVPQVSLFNNATIALLVAVKALETTGEVITTPYSFVATAHSLLWSGITPVFVDVEPETLNLDPRRIEEAITPRTTAIMPVHCYGRPCEVEAIADIARRHRLKVIYDAAHAFGVERGGRSLAAEGDLAVLSFHATKVFNTFEGGALVSPDAATKDHVDHLKNFGFENEVSVPSLGINGKMNEFNAAIGLLQLEHFAEAVERRAKVEARYRELLAPVRGIRCLPWPAGVRRNYAYFPILVGPEFGIERDGLHARMVAANIFTRRYFYPLISDFPMYRHLPSAAPSNLPVARAAAEAVLCLPMSSNLEMADVERIVAVVVEAARA